MNRSDFPILDQEVHGHPLAYLDNAASTQKPEAVIEAIAGYYRRDHANVHRGVHELSMRATKAYEGARQKVADFLNAPSIEEVIFTRGTTEAINLVAQSFGGSRVGEGDEILLSALEHHSNIVPWQLLSERTGARLRVVPVSDEGDLDLRAFQELLTDRTRIFSVNHVSNAIGTVNPIEEMIGIAHGRGVPVVIDGAQAAAHIPVDVQALDVDFYAFSGHKVYGPTGIGVLFGKKEHLEAMPPYQGGGDMIKSVTFEETIYNDLPFRFEAGTPNIADAVGLGVALEGIQETGFDRIAAHEEALAEQAVHLLQQIPSVRLIGLPKRRASVVSFVMEGVHPHDIGTIVDRQGIAIRTGHHCAQPLMERYGIPATARASFAIYNEPSEIERLADALLEVEKVFA